MDAVKVNQAFEEEASPASEPPTQILDVPVFDSFINHQDEWEKIQVHLIGVHPKDGTTSDAAGIKALNRFGFSLFAGSADPYVKVQTDGDDTGHEEYFPVGQHQFSTKKNATIPSWDERCLLLCKKGEACTSGIKFTMIDAGRDREIMNATIERSKFPAAGEGWKQLVEVASTPSEEETFVGLELHFALKVTCCTDKIVSQEDMANFCKDSSEVSYTEEVIEGDPGHDEDNALLQCWRHKTPVSKAVLWLLGRNDCFMHPHVAQELFLDQGYDIYVLNWSAVGLCRKRGWVTDAFLNSHNRLGNPDLYLSQIDQSLDKIHSKESPYEKVLGYAHSTGGIILINYLIKRGDSRFCGFLFNSPLLDWEQVGLQGVAVEKLASFLSFCRVKDVNSIIKLTLMTAGSLKEVLDGKSLDYLGRDIDLSAWSMTLWSQYHFDFRARPFFTVPMTVGFIDFVAEVDKALSQLHKEKKHVTLKPVVCFATKLDDTLVDYNTTLDRIDAIGPSRCEIQMRHNSHDIFLSQDKEDNEMAMDFAKVWMRARGFA